MSIDHTNIIEHKLYVATQEEMADGVESSKRTCEIEDFSNLYLIHPIAARLTPLLARMRVSPNAVSCAGMICGLLAGWAYFYFQDIRFAVGGFLLMLAWHILDGVDGQLARLTNRQSELGKIIDGVADNVTFAAVYAGLGLALTPSLGIWAWLLVGTAAIAHSLQAAAYEFQRQEYDFWGRDKQSAEFKSADTLRAQKRPRSLVKRLANGLGQSYARTQHMAARVDNQYRDKIAANLAMHPERARLIRRRYRQTFSSLVRTWSVMSSNCRTLLIFVTAVLNIPQLYFIIELLVFTPLTLLMIRQQKLKSREFSRFLDQQTE